MDLGRKTLHYSIVVELDYTKYVPAPPIFKSLKLKLSGLGLNT